MFSLLSSMGAVDLAWRKGGVGGGAADGGRDLEAKFPRSTPDGDFELESWWIESKGREGSVEADAVKSAIINASGYQDVDVIVIVTNTQFTNPTRDWVSEWSRTHPRPRIRLWDRPRLQILIEKHPLAAARIMPSILDDDERIETLANQFWEAGRIPLIEDASYFWNKTHAIASMDAITCMVAAEVIYGDLGDRPWGTLIDRTRAHEAAVYALAVFPMTFMRIGNLPDKKLEEISAYLLQCAIRAGDPASILEVLKDPLSFIEGKEVELFKQASESYQKYIATPLWNAAAGHLRDACMQDCGRLMGEVSYLGQDPASEIFWRRFNKNLPSPSDRILTIVNRNEPCAIGLPISDDRECPFFDSETPSLTTIEDIGFVIRKRMIHPDGQWQIKRNPSNHFIDEI
ncbi:hypothetical protein PS9374_04672 [Planomonospora sphaerica]|uniref:Restriction endonuclease type IV Mrr domain-containing protein n=1 Tax=Planomonospora sphaerica TaxID=161355 RepID=A0A171DJK0_9ACTN|nr:hypothetical protein PS9374_04672 [Planomonospora sphaerica]